jgi:hypothetical protein
VPHLKSYPHHCGSLNVVGLGQGKPPAAGTDVPGNGLDPLVTMLPDRGGRVAPPIKAAISVNPAAGASAPVWGTTAVGGTATACAPARSATGASAPIRATVTVPLGVHSYPLRRLLPRCLPRQLELVVSVIVDRNRATGATIAQSLELCRHHTCCICHHCCFYFCPCCCQFCHRRPCRRRYSLCRGNLDLLPVLRARGD